MSHTWNKFTPLAVADFTSVGTGLTLTDTKYGVNFVKASNSSAHNLAGMYKTAPGTPYTVTTCLQNNGQNPVTGIVVAGLGWSDGTKYVFFYIFTNSVSGGLSFGIGKYTNTTTFSADYQTHAVTYLDANNLWLQISDNGTDRICRVSKDGINFAQIHSVGRTDFLTPTRVGVFVNPFSAATNFTISSWTGA